MQQPETPAWHNEPLIQRIANALLDRLEQGPQARKTPPAVELDRRVAPELHGQTRPEEKEYHWRLVEKMADVGWVAVRTMERGHKDDPPYVLRPKAVLASEGALRALTRRPAERPASWADRFLAAVAKALGADHPAVALLKRAPLRLEAYDPEVAAAQLARLPELASQPLLLREVAAKLFFGQSKVLDHRQTLIAAILGMPECPFPESPVQLNVHLPSESFTAVLFVENRATFEALARRRPAGTENLAFVLASGYQGSAKRLRMEQGASVYFAAAAFPEKADAERFLGWLRENSPALPVTFYGDLDEAGMDILARLRETFPGIDAWQAGYASLLATLEAGGGHPPEAADKAGQRSVSSTGCPYADSVLLPALRRHERFVDQELA